MSKENVALIKGIYDAFAGGKAACFQQYADTPQVAKVMGAA